VPGNAGAVVRYVTGKASSAVGAEPDTTGAAKRGEPNKKIPFRNFRLRAKLQLA
jgi:hypothetical protein